MRSTAPHEVLELTRDVSDKNSMSSIEAQSFIPAVSSGSAVAKSAGNLASFTGDQLIVRHGIYSFRDALRAGIQGIRG